VVVALTVQTKRVLALTRFGELERDVEKFATLCESFSGYGGPCCKPEECRAILASLPVLRQRWSEVDRPVTTENIASEILWLTGAYTTTTARADMDAFVSVLAEDIVDLRPTAYGFHRACKQYRRKYKFLGISDLVAEVERAEHVTAKTRCLLREFPLEERIADFEAEIPRLVAAATTDKRRRLSERFVRRYLVSKGREVQFFWMFGYWPEG
jgi:hypothetical protein